MVGFMENESNIAEPNKGLEQKIFLTSVMDAKVQIKMGDLPAYDVSIPKNQVINIDVPRTFENFTSEVIRKNIVEINSDVPIMVYAFSSLFRSSDSYSAIPVANWGKEYVAVSMPNDQYNKVTLDSAKDFTPRSSEILVMSAYDGTNVTIIPKSVTRNNMPVDQPIKITLNKGECYLVQSFPYSRGSGDLSGTIIRSDKPSGVLSGHVRTAILQGFIEQPPDSKDHLVEMLTPTSSWGKNFVSVPFKTNPNKGDYFKICGIVPGTQIDVVTPSGVQKIKLNAGQMCETLIGLNEPALWVASSPVQVAQFMYRTGDTLETANYDPSMVILSPTEQFVSKIIFETPGEVFQYIDGEKFIAHYISLITDSNALQTLKLDNVTLKTFSNITTQRITSSDLFWDVIKIGPGKHEITCDTGKFSGIIFGVGRFDSYAMTLGSSLQNPDIPDNIPPQIEVKDSCYCINGRIFDEISQRSFGIYYAYFRPELSNNFNVNILPIASDATEINFTACPVDIFKDGSFTIDYMDKSGNSKRYTYYHQAVKLEFLTEIPRQNIDWNDSICFNYIIYNKGLTDQNLISADLTGDPRLKLYLPGIVPLVIKAGDSLILNLCINPKRDSSSLACVMNLDFGCGLKYNIPVTANIVAIDLTIKPVDFKKVLIGDTKCDSVLIINNSNVPISLLNSQFVVGTQPIIIDTTGLFPYILEPSATFKIPVCFTPDKRSSYQVDIIVKNNFSTILKTYIKGEGIAPLMSSVIIDWGEKRVGSTNDSSEIMNNTGNTDGLVSFGSFITKSSDDGNTSYISAIKDLKIAENSQAKLDFSFKPVSVGNYLVEALMSSNWKLHPEFKITLKGIGTLPVINTKDLIFEDTEIYKYRDTNAVIINNSGNEILSIDSIYVINGDSSSFEIDYSKLKNFTVGIGEDYKIPVRFKPSKLGLHQLNLGVMNDANPNYLKTPANFKILGNSIIPQSSDIEILFVTNSIYACLFDTVIVTVKNKGESAVNITDLKIEKIPDVFWAEVLDFKALTLNPGAEVSFKIGVYAERNKGGEIKANVEFFSQFVLSKSFKFEPITSDLKIISIPVVKYSAGDTVQIRFGGYYPGAVDTLSGFYFRLNLSSQYLFLNSENIKLNIIENNITRKIDLNLNKTNDFIELSTISDNIRLTQNSEWYFYLSFLGLLSEKQDSTWVMNFSSDRCFNPAQDTLNTMLNDICIFNVRHIQQITNAFIANVYPNPANGVLGLKVIMPEDDYARIFITDAQGKEFTLENGVFLEKGEHFLKYQINYLPTGVYFAKFCSLKFAKNILFVVID